ncbi:MAG: hypothetical protein EHM93_05465 [Bacteroidales bacterium]|nr:MAG: hypothetical protein EHM93_05465 [Bacteroidales bacterium]
MRIIRFIFAGILITFSFSLFAEHKQFAFQVDNDTTNYAVNKNIYRLITNGIEKEIKNYFSAVSLDELIKSDSGAIVKAFKRINTNDKVSRTIWILEEVKNRNVEVRAYVYNELLKIDFGKPSFLLNHMINNYFTNYTEKEITLSEKVRKIHKKMNR